MWTEKASRQLLHRAPAGDNKQRLPQSEEYMLGLRQNDLEKISSSSLRLSSLHHMKLAHLERPLQESLMVSKPSREGGDLMRSEC